MATVQVTDDTFATEVTAGLSASAKNNDIKISVSGWAILPKNSTISTVPSTKAIIRNIVLFETVIS